MKSILLQLCLIWSALGICRADTNAVFTTTTQRHATGLDRELQPGASEKLPWEQDLRGNWSSALNGLQLSLRFEKEEFLAGEPVIAILLVRNVSENEIMIRDSGFPQHSSMGKFTIVNSASRQVLPAMHTLYYGSIKGVSLSPKAQDRYEINLEEIFDLSKPGSYLVYASYPFKVFETNSEELISGPVPIRILPATNLMTNSSPIQNERNTNQGSASPSSAQSNSSDAASKGLSPAHSYK
jgi:hypothetical protein